MATDLAVFRPSDDVSNHQPSHTSWQVYHAAGELSSTIRVSNLSTNISGPSDAWGRPNRPQPIQVSVEISFRKPFSTTSSGDALKGDTVHYGMLSKHVLKVVEDSEGMCLSTLVLHIRESLIGPTTAHTGGKGTGLLSGTEVRYIKVGAHVPKATKLGSGVSIIDSVVLEDGSSVQGEPTWGNILKFHDLKVPVLIGVNDNERMAKQLVVANVEIDRWAVHADAYDQIEEHITKSMEESSFETLEALAMAICRRLSVSVPSPKSQDGVKGHRYKVSLEKPIAVTLADAPCVELSVEAKDVVHLE